MVKSFEPVTREGLEASQTWSHTNTMKKERVGEQGLHSLQSFRNFKQQQKLMQLVDSPKGNIVISVDSLKS